MYHQATLRLEKIARRNKAAIAVAGMVLFFLVLLVPFTLNGIAVREAFFISFLGSVGVSEDAAFAAGFLFFLVTVAVALPGWGLIARDGLLGGRRTVRHG